MQEVVTDQNSLDLSSDSMRPRTGPAASSPSNELFPSSPTSKVQTQDWRKTGKEFIAGKKKLPTTELTIRNSNMEWNGSHMYAVSV